MIKSIVFGLTLSAMASGAFAAAAPVHNPATQATATQASSLLADIKHDSKMAERLS